ncbi:MAG TPA: DUF3017 domain-containing protein [Mycobacteriales bacterium]|nr:DUF3017 domain-containing protein [Mycobacteriales bacterium]
MDWVRTKAAAARQVPLLGVLVLVGVGLIVIAADRWARGLVLLAAGLILGAGLRLMLPTRRAGLLVVRSRPFDVACLLGVAVAVLALAGSLR